MKRTTTTHERELLTPTELSVLEASYEQTVRQQELLPLLAKQLGVAPEEVFYTWAFRRCQQRGVIADTNWAYYFHGLECDLKNSTDGRFLRLDFGPKGTVQTFTLWGVVQFVMTSVHPWPEFAELKELLADSAPPYDQYSGSLQKMAPIWDVLAAKGMFEEADPGLVELKANCTLRGADGLFHIRFPADVSEQIQIDCSVAGRTRLSPMALDLLSAPV